MSAKQTVASMPPKSQPRPKPKSKPIPFINNKPAARTHSKIIASKSPIVCGPALNMRLQKMASVIAKKMALATIFERVQTDAKQIANQTLSLQFHVRWPMQSWTMMQGKYWSKGTH